VEGRGLPLVTKGPETKARKHRDERDGGSEYQRQGRESLRSGGDGPGDLRIPIVDVKVNSVVGSRSVVLLVLGRSRRSDDEDG